MENAKKLEAFQAKIDANIKIESKMLLKMWFKKLRNQT